MKNMRKKPVETTVKTRQAIADEYGIDRKTLYNWLIGIRAELLFIFL